MAINSTKLDKYYQLAKKDPVYRKIYRHHSLPEKITSYHDWLLLPVVNRSHFYTHPIPKDAVYLAKSRPDQQGREPFLPLDITDYHNFINHEAAKFKQLGVKSGDRCSIIEFATSETILMAQAFIRLGAKFIILEGPDDIIFQDIIKKRINVIFTQSRMFPRLMDFFKNHPQKTSVKLIISTGEKVTDLNETRQRVKKILGAKFIDQIGSRETTSFAVSCSTCNHYHFLDQLGFFEILDPKTHQPAETGELIITPYWRENLPLVRYSTGDIVRRQPKECTCRCRNGSTFSGILGRVNHDIKVGSTMLPLKKIYDAAASAFYYQNKYIDYLLWGIIQQPEMHLVLMKNNDTDIILLVSERLKTTLTARRRKPLQRIIASLDYKSTRIEFIKLPQTELDTIRFEADYLDYRYVPRQKLHPLFLNALEKRHITITTIDG